MTTSQRVKIKVDAEYYVSTHDDIPALVLTVNLPELGEKTAWVFDTVLDADREDRSVTLLWYPDDDDEGWDRLDDVGEW